MPHCNRRRHSLRMLCAASALVLAGTLAAARADETSAAAPADAAPSNDAQVEAALKEDVILRAMVDELKRSAEKVELEDLARPYFIEYALMDVQGAYVAAELGALTLSNASPSRAMRVDVRVGAYELDNTNFAGAGWSFNRATVPIEDDYTAIRQALWWATDRDYKQAAEDFARKQAFMQQKVIEDKPADFSKEAPVVAFQERVSPDVPLAEMEKLAVELSAVFRDYPGIQESGVRMRGGGGNGYLVNTEGTRIRENGETYEIAIEATAQADDGMPLADTISLVAENFDELPPLAELQQQCRELAERLTRIKKAPKLTEAYAGPILVDARPAAAIFGANFGQRFAGGQRPIGSRSDPEDFEKKLGKRILPRSVTVVDDPTRETFSDVTLLGHYAYDDQGVPAQRVSLVEGGRLQALVMSRNPSKAFKQSTGHGRGLYSPSAMVGCLFVNSKKKKKKQVNY